MISRLFTDEASGCLQSASRQQHAIVRTVHVESSEFDSKRIRVAKLPAQDEVVNTVVKCLVFGLSLYNGVSDLAIKASSYPQPASIPLVSQSSRAVVRLQLPQTPDAIAMHTLSF